ncbi:MAG: hypothetical protein AB8E82_13335 [Aureispira sp.]
MIRFCLTLVILLELVALVQAQKATKEALKGACNCLSAHSLSELEGPRITILVDSCLEEGLYVNFSGVMREHGASLDHDSSMFALAQYLEQELTRSCVSFRQATKGLAASQLEEVKMKNKSSVGLLYQLNTNQQFPIFTLINADNEADNFIWMHEFDGSTRFMRGIEPYWYTPVEIVWKEVELYDQVTNQYLYYKEILLIQEQKKIDKKRRKAWIKAYERALKRKD